MREQPPDVYTAFQFEEIPFRINVRWNRYLKKWTWTLMPLYLGLENRAVQVYDKISPTVRRMKPSNTRQSLVQALDEALRRLGGYKKRWYAIEWDGLWVEG